MRRQLHRERRNIAKRRLSVLGIILVVLAATSTQFLAEDYFFLSFISPYGGNTFF